MRSFKKPIVLLCFLVASALSMKCDQSTEAQIGSQDGVLEICPGLNKPAQVLGSMSVLGNSTVSGTLTVSQNLTVLGSMTSREPSAREVELSSQVSSLQALLDTTMKNFEQALQAMNSTIKSLVNTPQLPSRAIVAWYSVASAPEGWVICDGTNGTPDLRNRFLLGVGDEVLGTTGGEKEHTLTLAEMPSHTHGMPDDACSGSGCPAVHPLGDGYANGRGTDPAGGNAPHNNMPPYTRVVYLMKV
jgi:hypothetical protein